MFAFSNLLIATAKILDIVLTVMYWTILVRALISWVNPDPFNPIVQFLRNVTEPILAPIRRMMPISTIDLSPIIAFLLIIFLQYFLVQTVFDLGVRLR